MKRITIVLFSLLVILSLCVSCGPRVIARGVLLWSIDEAEYPSGSPVDILTESELRQTYNIRYTDSQGREQFEEVEMWRVQLADDKDDLAVRLEAYSTYANMFGAAEIQALPVRSEMGTGATSDILYRLREGEIVKVLDRTPEPVDVGGLNDYWFEILTEDGTRGYVFGYRLDAQTGDGESLEKEEAGDDPLLASIVENVWRPDYFSWMIRDGMYDLARFRSDYAFINDPETKIFTLYTEDYRTQFAYSDLYRARYREYVAEGSGLLITAYDEYNISIQFSVNGETHQESLVRLDADIPEIITNENERRTAQRDAFIAAGRRLDSSRYGTINLSEDGSLSWTNYASLEGYMIPAWFTGTANLSFSLYLGPDVRGSFDGAISITQPGRSISNSLNFLYRETADGIQFEYVPVQNISRNVIQKQALTPFIIFFTRSN